MKKKIFLLVPLVIIIAFFIFLKNFKSSKIFISPNQNKFSVDFQLQKKDQKITSKLLQQLNLPQNFLNKAQFELDGTSSAKLAFISPIEGDLKFKNTKIDFSGKIHQPISLKSSVLVNKFKTPSSTSVEIFTTSFNELISRRFTLPLDFSKWLENNFVSDQNQHFILFGQKPDFAVILSPKKEIDLTTLSGIKIAKMEENPYKQENQNEITYHLLKIPQKNNQDFTFTFFQADNLTYMVSSFDAAKELSKNQKEPLTKLFSSGQKRLEFAFSLRGDPQMKKSAVNFLTQDTQKLPDVLDKIQSVELYVSDKKFWGTILLNK